MPEPSTELNFTDDHQLEAKLEQNLDGLIDEWAPDLRDHWAEAGWPTDQGNPEDFKGMHRTALISIARLRQAQKVAADARQALL